MSMICGVVACDDDPATLSQPYPNIGASDVIHSDVTGADDTSTVPGPASIPCEAPSANGIAVTGVVYEDGDGSDDSVWQWSIDADIDHVLSGINIQLVGADQVLQTESCDEGSFLFDDVADGTYLVRPQLDGEVYCSTRNCPRRFYEAVDKGEVTIVTIGDSVPVVGDGARFPTRLKTLLDPLVTVDNRNVAVSGSTSPQWLPGTGNFQQVLAPHIPDADVLLISVGGNDIMGYAGELLPGILGGSLDAEGAVEEAKMLVAGIAENIRSIAAAVREINPDVDVAYLLYPNYGQAVNTMPWSMVPGFLGDDAMVQILEAARSAIQEDDAIILVDMYGRAEGLPLDDYLKESGGQKDPLHFNDLGHTLYAEEIFETLGGVLVGSTPFDPAYGQAPLGLERPFGLMDMAP